MSDSISLNKFISDTGYCSRREADELIKAGRVLLNDKTAVMGNRYTPGDIVEVDGSLVTRSQKEKPLYIAFNKPVGITTTTEEHIPGNIIRYIGFHKRIFPIGRLDKDSEGLIFLTNDGDMVNKLLRAGNAHEKEYLVRVHRVLEPGFADKMSQGIPLDGKKTLPCKVQVTGRQSFRIVLVQGLNRQIRRMCEYLGYTVTALQRTRIMHVRLDKLAIGKWRYLSEAEMRQLLNSVADSSKTAPAAPKGFDGANAVPTGSSRPSIVQKAFNRGGVKTEDADRTADVHKKTAKKAERNPAIPKATDRGLNKYGMTKPAKKKASTSTKNATVANEKPAKPAAKKGSYKAFRDKRNRHQ